MLYNIACFLFASRELVLKLFTNQNLFVKIRKDEENKQEKTIIVIC